MGVSEIFLYKKAMEIEIPWLISVKKISKIFEYSNNFNREYTLLRRF